MKKIIMCLSAFLAFCAIIGCDPELPTIERMNTISTAIGKTAGYACELSKTKATVKTAILNVIDVASNAIPDVDQTFTDAWTPIITAELAKTSLKDGDLAIATIALKAVTAGIDYIFVKYPQAKTVKELVSVSVIGFVDGYKSVMTLAAGNTTDQIDEDALKFIKARLAK